MRKNIMPFITLILTQKIVPIHLKPPNHKAHTHIKFNAKTNADDDDENHNVKCRFS
jgi:hypothetical protein